MIPVPRTREPFSLLAVERALSEVRRGRPVALGGAGGEGLLVLAGEPAAPHDLAELAARAEASLRSRCSAYVLRSEQYPLAP